MRNRNIFKQSKKIYVWYTVLSSYHEEHIKKYPTHFNLLRDAADFVINEESVGKLCVIIRYHGTGFKTEKGRIVRLSQGFFVKGKHPLFKSVNEKIKKYLEETLL